MKKNKLLYSILLIATFFAFSAFFNEVSAEVNEFELVEMRRVKKDENLSLILNEYDIGKLYGPNGVVETTIKLNPELAKDKGNLIYPGQVLCIPVSTEEFDQQGESSSEMESFGNDMSQDVNHQYSADLSFSLSLESGHQVLTNTRNGISTRNGTSSLIGIGAKWYSLTSFGNVYIHYGLESASYNSSRKYNLSNSFFLNQKMGFGSESNLNSGKLISEINWLQFQNLTTTQNRNIVMKQNAVAEARVGYKHQIDLGKNRFMEITLGAIGKTTESQSMNIGLGSEAGIALKSGNTKAKIGWEKTTIRSQGNLEIEKIAAKWEYNF